MFLVEFEIELTWLVLLNNEEFFLFYWCFRVYNDPKLQWGFECWRLHLLKVVWYFFLFLLEEIIGELQKSFENADIFAVV